MREINHLDAGPLWLQSRTAQFRLNRWSVSWRPEAPACSGKKAGDFPSTCAWRDSNVTCRACSRAAGRTARAMERAICCGAWVRLGHIALTPRIFQKCKRHIGGSCHTGFSRLGPYLTKILATHWLRTLLINADALILLTWAVQVIE